MESKVGESVSLLLRFDEVTLISCMCSMNLNDTAIVGDINIYTSKDNCNNLMKS